MPSTTVDAADVARFSAIAEEWWDEKGKFAPLHRINPVRLAYIRERIVAHNGRDARSLAALEGLSVVDIGCGGGLVTEPMARMGATVTGLDASEKNVAVARLHAEQTGLTTIRYLATTAEELAEQGQQYDVVLALEIVEHVADVPAFLAALTQLVKPGGLLILSTINRTAKSYVLAIIGAEYVLRWLPVGTHIWSQFQKPHEIVQPLERHGLTTHDLRGMVMNPLTWQWSMSTRDLDVNWYGVFGKPV